MKFVKGSEMIEKNFQQKIRAIVCDADHTLYKLSSQEAYSKMFSFLSQKTGIKKCVIEITFKEEMRKLLSSTEAKNPEKRKRDNFLKYVLNKLNVELPENEIRKVIEMFWNEACKTLKPNECVFEFLEKTRKKGITLGVFTDEFRENLIKKLNRVFGEWKRYFDFLITPEDTGEMKPSEKYYEKILEITRCSSEKILVIGDSWERDLMLAKQYGMITVLISEKYEGNPDIYAKSFCELIKALVW